MNAILRLLQLCVGGCRHQHRYRERRELHGIQVLHWVCESCGDAVPAVQRTPSEHVRVVRQGAVKPLQARRLPAELPGVIAIGARRRAQRVDTWRRASSE